MLERIGGTPRLYRWLIVLGAALIASPLALTAGAYGTVASYREWQASLSRTVDSLTTLTRSAEQTGDPALPEYETALASRAAELERSARRLEGAQRSAARLWHVNGRGPLLVAAGAALVLLGLRVRRFEQFGD